MTCMPTQCARVMAVVKLKMSEELILHYPFNISFNIQEIVDTYESSFRSIINIKHTHSSGVFTYSASDIWFHTSDIDNFTIELKKLLLGEVDAATLQDMSKYFSYHIKHESIQLEIYEPSTNDSTATLSLEQNTHFEAIQTNLDYLNNFPKWWTA